MSRKTSELLKQSKHNDMIKDLPPDLSVTSEEFKTLLVQVKLVSLQKTHNLKLKYSKYKDLAREFAMRLSEEDTKSRHLQEILQSKEQELDKVKIAIVKLNGILRDVLENFKPSLEIIKQDILQLGNTMKSQCFEYASVDPVEINIHPDAGDNYSFKRNSFEEEKSKNKGEISPNVDCFKAHDVIENTKCDNRIPQSNQNQKYEDNIMYKNINSNNKNMHTKRESPPLQQHSFLCYSSYTPQKACSPCYSFPSRWNPQQDYSSFTSNASSHLPSQSPNSFLSHPQQQQNREVQQLENTSNKHSKLQLRKQTVGSSRKAYPSFHEDMQMTNTTITSSRESENKNNSFALSFQSALSQNIQQPSLSKYHNRSHYNSPQNNLSLPSTFYNKQQQQQQRQHSVSNHTVNSNFSSAQNTPLQERYSKHSQSKTTKSQYSSLISQSLPYSQLQNTNTNQSKGSNSIKQGGQVLTTSTKWNDLFAQLSKRSISGIKQQQIHTYNQYEPSSQIKKNQSSKIMKNA